MNDLAIPADQAPAPVAARRFDYLPVGLFASVMGLEGLSRAWRLAGVHFGLPGWPADSLALAGIAAFVALAAAYAVKALVAPDAVKTEFDHPIAGNLFGTIFISLLLLPFGLAPLSLAAARAAWAAGALGMLGFAWLIVSRWLSDRQQVAHATPAWIVPVVGLLDVPLAMPVLDLPGLHGLAVFSVAVGLFFAVPLFTLIFSRLLFEAPLPDALKPTLMILVAPFAVGYSAYQVAAGQADMVGEALYGLTLFILSVLIGQMRHLAKGCPFKMAWWAVSFPLAASAGAALRFAAANPGLFTDGVAILLLALATLTILGLLVRTLLGVARGELRSLSV